MPRCYAKSPTMQDVFWPTYDSVMLSAVSLVLALKWLCNSSKLSLFHFQSNVLPLHAFQFNIT